MKPSRKTQPYKKGSGQRSQGPALSAMLQGKPAFLPNPSHPPTQPQSGGMRGSLSQQVAQQVPRRRKRKTRTPLTARTA